MSGSPCQPQRHGDAIRPAGLHSQRMGIPARHATRRHLSLLAIAGAGISGSVSGTLLLSITPGGTFFRVVPWLLLLAAVLYALGPYLLRRFQQRGVGNASVAASVATILAVSIYGGYFNGGLGIMLSAA